MKYYVKSLESMWTYIDTTQGTNLSFAYCYYRPVEDDDGVFTKGGVQKCKLLLKDRVGEEGVDFFCDEEDELVEKILSDKLLRRLYVTFSRTNAKYQQKRQSVEH